MTTKRRPIALLAVKKINCTFSSKKKSARTGLIRIECERTLKPTHVISQKINLITGGGGYLNAELSCVYSSPSFKLQTISEFSDFYLVQDCLNRLSVISIVKTLFREQKIHHNFHDAVIDISTQRMTSK